MNKNNIWSVILLVVVIVLIAAGVVYISQPKSKYNQATLQTFALCLASKKMTMYGAEWCSHCQAQKALFGTAFKSVPYVECPENEKLCADKGVTGYPTWITADGTKYIGEQTLAKLGEVTACTLP